ncbi:MULTISPECIES: translation initiation factor IF-2 [Olivibacter]|uniref:Translation initiation factor IF-2 n=2 Tax=Olivibacter TaxID=376469 RepID=A0ABV6HHV2_9SPHI|nr:MULTISPECIES: translation initiation factor IF-2 [Olivibacter]MDM8176968.1 translation initiation factor IF-2 [Olivibacter sp. 47]MDX3912464.1 translation initiation factor IF-2 [Pseudosphingobacterium sp.]QEL00184.1 translation initiation factor IF-2 [Olivibacter sp. LS-1]
MTEGKSINLLKAAKELNIGIGTAVDFLAKKGYEIEAKPNTKLDRDMYEVLLREFQGDKIVKEEANQIVIGKIRREEAPIETTASKATQPEVENDEILIKNNSAFSPSVEDTKANAYKPQQKEPSTTDEQQDKAKEPSSEPTMGVKVVGKIDLSSLNQRSRPDKKPYNREEPKAEQTGETPAPAAEQKPEQPVETPKSASVTEEKPAAVQEEPKKQEQAPIEQKEQPKAEEVKANAPGPKEPEKEPAPQNEVIRARAEHLSGPKVIGKIELPTSPQKRKDQPIASSSGAGSLSDHKRKRKRNTLGGNQNRNQGDNTQQQRGGQPAGGGQTQNRPHPGQGQNQGPNQGGQRPDQRGGKGKHDFKGRGRHVETPKEEPSEKEIQDQIKATLARLSGAGKSGKFAQRAKLRRQKRDDVALSAEEAALEREMQSKVLRVTEFVTANDLANMMDVSVTQVISTCMSLGIFASINQRLDAETLTIVADEFGYEVEFVKPEDEETHSLEEDDNPDNLVQRAPIVTVMGHVDHGKTSLLDYIRKTNVIGGEAGGITQHIGAYAVKLDDGRKITFLDTPGHEAFTAMRARGAKITDIAIIVIAADDSVMPQTKEAINHAQAAGVPIVFAFTKIDKPGANADKIREQLSTMNILVEDWGGKYQAQEISGKTGLNVDLLLEKVLLEAEMLDLKADPKKRAVGSVVEAALDKGRGIVTTVLIQGGTLRVGDPILAGSHSGKVKALTNERGQKVTEAGPSTPIQILGMNGAPTAGDKFYVLESEAEARQIANKRLQLQREQGLRTQKHITLDEIGRRLAIGNFKELNVIVKGDVDGSIEALSDSLLKLSTEEIQVNIIHKSVGQISESDVLLASASDAIIIGFQVRPSQNARKLAEQEQIDIRLYSIIYDAIEELKAAMEGMLAPKFEEKIVANVEIRETFKISKVGTIAGCMVLDGKINRNHDIRLIRDGVVVYSGKLASLKRYKDDVKEVSQGYECGLSIQNFNDIKVGDIVEAYEQVEVKRKL